MRSLVLSLLIIVFAASIPGYAAEPPKLSLPIACEPGRDCWLVNYVDHDGSEGGFRDYACGRATYDSHGGTDFAVPTLAAMHKGVPVIASADGMVVGVRDGEIDGLYLDQGPEAVGDKECGNGVMVEHEGGLSTQYCHLLNGSVKVSRGQLVKRGDLLGWVGLSGRTAFPHVHLTVYSGGEKVDPFLGLEATNNACRMGEAPLWEPEVLKRFPYQPTAPYLAGFAPGRPDPKAMRAGDYQDMTLDVGAQSLTLWVDVFNPRADDHIFLQVLNPEGDRVITSRVVAASDGARAYFTSSLYQPDGGLVAGEYVGQIWLVRRLDSGDQKTWTMERRLTVR